MEAGDREGTVHPAAADVLCSGKDYAAALADLEGSAEKEGTVGASIARPPKIGTIFGLSGGE